jgi:hypothetical protein
LPLYLLSDLLSPPHPLLKQGEASAYTDMLLEDCSDMGFGGVHGQGEDHPGHWARTAPGIGRGPPRAVGETRASVTLSF